MSESAITGSSNQTHACGSLGRRARRRVKPNTLAHPCFLLLLILFLPVLRYQAQEDSTKRSPLYPEPPLSEEMQENIELNSQNTGAANADYSPLTDPFTAFLQHPLGINTASREALAESGLFNPIQIVHLLDYIHEHGKLISLYELQAVDGFDVGTIRRIRPYISLNRSPDKPSLSLRSLIHESNQQLSLTCDRVLEPQKGFSPLPPGPQTNRERYLGSPAGLKLRYTYTWQNSIHWGFLARKDPGEQFFRGIEKQGFDFYSPFFGIHNRGRLKSLVVGNYSLSIGQGLVAWSGIAFSKTADACLISKTSSGLREYTASDKTNFLQGVGLCLRTGLVESTFFYAHQKEDARVTDTLANGSQPEVRSLRSNGVHATLAEAAMKNRITRTLAGTHLAFNKRLYQIGLTALSTLFSASVEPRFKPYNAFEFRGKTSTNLGSDYSLVWQNIHLFGEAAWSFEQNSRLTAPAYALLQGIQIAAAPRLSLALLYRNYQRNYNAFLANAFSEGGKTNNEQGAYLGFVLNPGPRSSLSAYADLFSFPWLKYRIDAPSKGFDCFAKYSFNLSRKTAIYLHVRSRQKFQDPPLGSAPGEISSPLTYLQTNYRINLSSSIYSWLMLRSRIEAVIMTDSAGQTETGFLISQFIRIQSPKNPFAVCVSYSLFDTPSANTRIYAFENTVPGNFSIPAFSGKGSRIQALLGYRACKPLLLWVSVARIYFDDRNVISPHSLQEINSSHRTEATLQLSLRF